jgi:hypothetical protein
MAAGAGLPPAPFRLHLQGADLIRVEWRSVSMGAFDVSNPTLPNAIRAR